MLEPDAYARKVLARDRRAMLARDALSAAHLAPPSGRDDVRDVKRRRLPLTAVRLTFGFGRSRA